MLPVWAKSFQKKVAVIGASVSFSAVGSSGQVEECREYSTQPEALVVLTFSAVTALLTSAQKSLFSFERAAS
jgi:hypothetical protein